MVKPAIMEDVFGLDLIGNELRSPRGEVLGSCPGLYIKTRGLDEMLCQKPRSCRHPQFEGRLPAQEPSRQPEIWQPRDVVRV
jgi:hypothetical protein